MKELLVDSIRENAPDARWLAKAALENSTLDDLSELGEEFGLPWNSPAASYLLLRMVADTGRFPAHRDVHTTHYVFSKNEGMGRWLHHLAGPRGLTPYVPEAMAEFLRAQYGVDAPPPKRGDVRSFGGITVEVPDVYPPVLRVTKAGSTKEYIFVLARADVPSYLDLVDGVGAVDSVFAFTPTMRVLEATPRVIPPQIMENLPGRLIPAAWLDERLNEYGMVRLLLKADQKRGFFVTITAAQ